MASRQRQSNRVDYGLQSFTCRLDLKSLEITVDSLLLFFFFSLKKKIKNAQNDQLTRHTKCGKRGNERLDWGTLKPEVDHNTDMRTVHILTKVNAVVHFTVLPFFQVFIYIIIHSLVFKKINTSLQNNMAVSHWGKKEKDFVFFCFLSIALITK